MARRLRPRALLKSIRLAPTGGEYEELRPSLWFPEEVEELLYGESEAWASEDISLGRVRPEDREETIKRHLYELERVWIVYSAAKISRFPPRDDDD